VASAATVVSETKKTRPYIALVIPMSRTRPALSRNERSSTSGRPKSLTSRAPETLKRSVMLLVIEAFRAYDSRVSACSLVPMSLAGMTNTGSSTSDSRVICQDRTSIAASVSTTPMTLDTTPDSVPVKACWAPSTSLFRRLISAPVCVRVKKAIGMREMCV
jgi:hypothetical protein